MPLFAAFFIAFAALSYTRAHAGATAAAQPSARPAAEIVAALRTAKPAEVPALETELLGHGAEAVKPLVELMAAKRGQNRVMVMIANLGTKAPPALIALLPDDALRPNAAKVLAHAAGVFSADQAEELLACIGRYPDAKHSCGIALVRGMGPKQARWVPRLAKSLKSADRDERLYAALALRQIGLKVPGVREALMTVVSDPDDEIRQAVRKTGLRPAPAKAAPAKTGAKKASAKAPGGKAP